MLIFLDGPDRVGKDSLIDQFRKHFKSPLFQVFHEGKPPSDVDQKKWAVEHYGFMLRNAFTHQHSSISVYNRSHLGEVVWGPKYRGYDADFIFDLERQYLSYAEDAYLILLTDSADRLMARDDGKSLTKSTTELDDVRGRFSAAFDKSCIRNKLHVKLEDVAFDDVFPKVWSFLTCKE